MKIYGVDFTSAPSSRKPITVAAGRLSGLALTISEQFCLSDWESFEAFLQTPGPWFGGFDLPFSQSRTFIVNSGMPAEWGQVIDSLPLDKLSWRRQLDDYKRDRAPGDKQHMRETDRICKSCSPQMQYGVPVAMMFFEGMRRIRAAGVRCTPMEEAGDRTAVEAYPGVVMDQLIGCRAYKSDAKRKQTHLHLENRKLAVAAIQNQNPFGITVEMKDFSLLVTDATGDRLDAVLCALQAAYAFQNGFPPEVDKVEGWIPVPRNM